VQHASEPLVGVKSGILQGLIENRRSLAGHLFVRPVGAVNPHDGRLISVLIGVRCWPTERIRLVRRKVLSVLGVVSVSEGMLICQLNKQNYSQVWMTKGQTAHAFAPS
jgi:hypothetical protein